MPVIAVAATKGGTSKTTLIANLSVRAAIDGQSVALDYDPQESLDRWHELRGRPGNPSVHVGTSRGARIDVERMKQTADWVFLDLPPATQGLIREGVRAADFVLIPVKTSPLDLEAIDPILELCEHHKKPFAFVLSMYDPKWKLSETAFAYLDKIEPGKTLRSVFGYRQAYVGSMIDGRTGPEYDADPKQAKAAAAEVDALWAEIKGRLK
jgi:chromosome partitioning protein